MSLTETDQSSIALPSAARKSKRVDLAAFLRSRRARLAPSDVGLAPGLRRRTPGLRREEVAQLAGVGVTWYTWLEQGRPINVSTQVLDAIVRTLRLDQVERDHLYDLAGVPRPQTVDGPVGCVTPALGTILSALSPLPASVQNSRYDVLAWNDAYAAVFPRLVSCQPEARNSVWHTFVAPGCCNAFVNREEDLAQLVASFRAGYGRHLGEPAWTNFVDRLLATSPEFAQLWARHDVAKGWAKVKIFRHAAVGELTFTSTGLALTATPETRLLVYTPIDDESSDRVRTLLDLGERSLELSIDHRH